QEAAADPVDGPDDHGGADLRPQRRDVGVERAALRLPGGAPDLVEDDVAAHHVRRPAGQQQEQVELLAGERHGLVLDGDLAGADLDPDRAEVERSVGGAHGAGQPGAAQHGVDAGQQFGDAERLDDVVVGAGAQAAYPFVLLRARGHGDDGGFGAVAQLADHVEPIAVGQAQVDEDDVGGVG